MHNNNTQLLEYIYFCRKNIVGKYSIYRVIIMHPHRMPNYYHLSYAPFTHAGTGVPMHRLLVTSSVVVSPLNDIFYLPLNFKWLLKYCK